MATEMCRLVEIPLISDQAFSESETRAVLGRMKSLLECWREHSVVLANIVREICAAEHRMAVRESSCKAPCDLATYNHDKTNLNILYSQYCAINWQILTIILEIDSVIDNLLLLNAESNKWHGLRQIIAMLENAENYLKTSVYDMCTVIINDLLNSAPPPQPQSALHQLAVPA